MRQARWAWSTSGACCSDAKAASPAGLGRRTAVSFALVAATKVLVKLQQFRSAVDPQAFLRFLDMWTRTNFSSEMVDLETPALVLVRRHDFMAFSEQAMQQTFGTWFRHSQITVLEGAGHYPMSETPLSFVAEVEAILSRQD